MCQINRDILIFTGISVISPSTIITFTCTEMHNPIVTDFVIIGISRETDGNKTWQGGEIQWVLYKIICLYYYLLS